ncbi:MAG: oligosaccharide flippase family protein [Anaerolineae bacterium]|nr:oligosaccharide flippase family protein [Anaerolineae bacterium]
MKKVFPDALIVAGLLLLPLLFFAPVTVGGRTLLPADNLYQFEPWRSARDALGVPEIPHNALLSDLVLQNYQWKTFLRRSLDAGTIPLWQPNQFAGTPFLAAGQHGALYPFSALYYILPLPRAYGWFTVSQLWLAGALMYLFARGLGQGRAAGTVAGVAYQFSAFFIVSAVFPMMIAGAAWLPLLLLIIEFIIERRPLRGDRPATVPWLALGALALMMNIFAGHVEITYYTLIVMAYWAAARLLWAWWRDRAAWRRLARPAGSLLLMVALGVGLGAAQFLPLYELGTHNFREAAASFGEVRGYAFPARHVAKFLLPDAFGNPAQHSYRDVFSGDVIQQDWQRPCAECPGGFARVTDTDFGVKNYVEGGAYVGVLTLVLATVGLLARRGASSLSAHASPPKSPSPAGLERGASPPTAEAFPSLAVPGGSGGGVMPQPGPAAPHRAILGLLALVSLTFAFGLPTYAALYYAFPNLNQLHTPFRWVWPFTFCAAALAGFGLDALRRAAAERARWVTWLGGGLIALGAALLGGLLLSRAAYDSFAPLVERVFTGLSGADQVFPDARAFYSYQFWNGLTLGLLVLAAGIVVTLSRNRARLPRRLGGAPLWTALATGVVALDLAIAGWGFNPSADPAWLDYTPDAVRWLQERQAEGVPFRYTTINFGAQPLHANSTWRYDLHDVRGYDSMIPRQYAEYMGLIAAQGGLLHNRIDPIAGDNQQALASPLLDLLNVRYIVTDQIVADAEALGLREVYADEAVRIYENVDALPRAYTLPYYDLTQPLCGARPDDFATIVSSPDFSANPRRVVIEGFPDAASCELVYEWPGPQHEADPVYAQITHYGAIEVIVQPEVAEESWLVLADSFYPGWKAFVRPAGSGEDPEQETPLHLVNGNFRGVRLGPGAWTVRFRYSPATFQVGAFLSFLSGMLLIFMLMLWLWRRLYRPDAEADSARRIAKNSLAPIVLNLFNRGIDFAFAFIMLRILGPADAGVYYYAVVIFGWFDILANFGLNTLLTREVARDRGAAGRYLLNSTALRLALSVLGVPLLIGFLALRQATVSPALEGQAIVAILLLYVGLLPGSISTGLTALFYAFEKAEHPAAITTVSTLVKVTLGLGTLLLGWGVVGLAGGAVLTNVVTLAALGWLARPLARGVLAERLDGALMRGMIGASWPLMINHLLATVFFKIDIVLMEAINGNTIVGQYSTAYKWLDALNIIPAFLTMALLPVMARQAHEDRAALRRNYTLAVKLLVIVALPVAVMTTFIAAPLIRVLGGAEYLPAGGIALQIMIWSIPIGWINSVTNYVIVALDRQRTLTLAFAAGVIFNVAANLVFLPAYSYRAAAVIHILSEATLFAAFYWIIRQEIGGMGWRRALIRPALAALGLLGITLALWQVVPLAGLLLSPLVYGAMLLALRPFGPEELARVAPLLPGRLRRWALRFDAKGV